MYNVQMCYNLSVSMFSPSPYIFNKVLFQISMWRYIDFQIYRKKVSLLPPQTYTYVKTRTYAIIGRGLFTTALVKMGSLCGGSDVCIFNANWLSVVEICEYAGSDKTCDINYYR